jgi:hypothetical protein
MTSAAPDLSLLHDLADHGDQEATHELDRLMADGNEAAGRLLTRIAVGRGDLRELQRLADAGSDSAVGALTQGIRSVGNHT